MKEVNNNKFRDFDTIINVNVFSFSIFSSSETLYIFLLMSVDDSTRK